MEQRTDPRAVLRAYRQQLMDAIAQTPEGRELVRVDAALLALGEDPAVVSAPTERIERSEAEPARSHRNGKRRAVRVMAESLLDEAPKAWSYDEIMAEYEARGEPVEAADPRSALRTAMWTLTNEKIVTKLSDGRFMATKFVTTSPAEAEPEHQEAGP